MPQDMSVQEIISFLRRKQITADSRVKTAFGRRTSYYFHYKGVRLQVPAEDVRETRTDKEWTDFIVHLHDETVAVIRRTANGPKPA